MLSLLVAILFASAALALPTGSSPSGVEALTHERAEDINPDLAFYYKRDEETKEFYPDIVVYYRKRGENEPDLAFYYKRVEEFQADSISRDYASEPVKRLDIEANSVNHYY